MYVLRKLILVIKYAVITLYLFMVPKLYSEGPEPDTQFHHLNVLPLCKK